MDQVEELPIEEGARERQEAETQRRIVDQYGSPGEVVEDVNDVEKRYATAVAEVIAERCPGRGTLKALDISANDLRVTAQVCRQLDRRVSAEVMANDLSYAPNDERTELLEIAETRAEQLETTQAKISLPLLTKAAQDLTLEDVGGKELGVVLDRLGATWHAINARDLERLEGVLKNVRRLLGDGGIFILDGQTQGIGMGFATVDKLKLFLNESGEGEIEAFANKNGFSSSLERRDNHALLVLTKK